MRAHNHAFLEADRDKSANSRFALSDEWPDWFSLGHNYRLLSPNSNHRRFYRGRSDSVLQHTTISRGRADHPPKNLRLDRSAFRCWAWTAIILLRPHVTQLVDSRLTRWQANTLVLMVDHRLLKLLRRWACRNSVHPTCSWPTVAVDRYISRWTFVRHHYRAFR